MAGASCLRWKAVVVVIAFAVAACGGSGGNDGGGSVVFEDDFSSGMSNWLPSDLGLVKIDDSSGAEGPPCLKILDSGAKARADLNCRRAGGLRAGRRERRLQLGGWRSSVLEPDLLSDASRWRAEVQDDVDESILP